MDIKYFNIDGPCQFTPKRFGDARGFFMESFRQSSFEAAAKTSIKFVQDNHSRSAQKGTVRGLHFQTPPHPQGKLVRCIKGKILDIAVDARKASPTYGRHIKAELSEENNAQLWVPPGFLHGFVTLSDAVDVQYKCTDYYAPDCDGSVLWNDPDLGIDWGSDWGFDPKTAILSDKDKAAQRFADFISPF